MSNRWDYSQDTLQMIFLFSSLQIPQQHCHHQQQQQLQHKNQQQQQQLQLQLKLKFASMNMLKSR